MYATRVELVGSYAVPCPEKEILEEIDHAGLLLVLDVADGRRGLVLVSLTVTHKCSITHRCSILYTAIEGKVQRVCVGTTHVVCTHARGFRKLGQMMALLSAAKVLMKRNVSMPLSKSRPPFSVFVDVNARL